MRPVEDKEVNPGCDAEHSADGRDKRRAADPAEPAILFLPKRQGLLPVHKPDEREDCEREPQRGAKDKSVNLRHFKQYVLVERNVLHDLLKRCLVPVAQDGILRCEQVYKHICT